MILNKKLENYWLILLSLPSWECGLKLIATHIDKGHIHVAPFVGVWIEIRVKPTEPDRAGVAPFVGVWIEIYASV